MIVAAVFPCEQRNDRALVVAAERHQLLRRRIGLDLRGRFRVDIPVLAPVSRMRALVRVDPGLGLFGGYRWQLTAGALLSEPKPDRHGRQQNRPQNHTLHAALRLAKTSRMRHGRKLPKWVTGATTSRR